jgi:hypothetical protein
MLKINFIGATKRHSQHWAHKTQDEAKQNKNKKTTQQTKQDELHGPHQYPGMNRGARER